MDNTINCLTHNFLPVFFQCASLVHTYTHHTPHSYNSWPPGFSMLTASFHNGHGTTVFVATDMRVYIIPDILPMLCKMQATVGENSFNPRFEDSRAVHELYTLLIPPTINQNNSWVRER